MDRLISITKPHQIPLAYRHTPIGLLLKYHNFRTPFDSYHQAQLLIGMCMDNRKSLHIPDNFAYIIRAGGANLRYSEFKVSYAIAVGGVKCISLIGHNNCGMVNLATKRDAFIKGLVEKAGWDRGMAEEHFIDSAPKFEIGNEVEFVRSEAKRLRLRYPKVVIAPMLYRIEDNLLYLIKEG
jgi:carbonic anhydrase